MCQIFLPKLCINKSSVLMYQMSLAKLCINKCSVLMYQISLPNHWKKQYRARHLTNLLIKLYINKCSVLMYQIFFANHWKNNTDLDTWQLWIQIFAHFVVHTKLVKLQWDINNYGNLNLDYLVFHIRIY